MFYIGIIVKDRVDCLKVLLKSLQPNIEKVRVVDASEKPLYNQVKDLLPGCKKYIHNSIEEYKAVNHNKNILIHDFLNSSAEYLFLIEDDVKILDNDVFNNYIDISNKYNIPHLNAILKQDKNNHLVYTLENEIDVCNRIYGYFSFFSRDVLETVGRYAEELNHNCWEHIEHTARIHQKYNYDPEFFAFPDIHNSWEQIRYMSGKKITSTPKDIIEKDKQKMFNNLGWKNFPLESIKKLRLQNFINN